MEFVDFAYAVRRGRDLSVGRKRALASLSLTPHEVCAIVAFTLNQSASPG